MDNRKPVLQNTCWLTAGKTVQLMVHFILGILMARYLGPEDYGLLSYGAAFTGAVTCLCNLGIPSVLVKELTDSAQKEGEILGTSLVLQGISSVFWAGMLLWLVYQTEGGDPVILGIVGLSGFGMVLRILENFRLWFQAKQMCHVMAYAAILAAAAAGVYKLVLLIQGKGVVWFACAASIETVCFGLILYILYRKQGGRCLRFSLEQGKQLLRKSCHFILPGLMVAVYGQADRFLLKFMQGEQELGFYTTAVSLSGAWCYALSALIDAMYPEITQAYSYDRALFRQHNRKLYALIFYLSAGAALMITGLAEPAVKILYGDRYYGTVKPLQILTWSTGLSFLGVARNAWVVCENRQKYLLGVYGSGAVCNLFLNVWLIPHWGAAGAATASLISQLVTAFAAPLCIRELRPNVRLMLEGIMGIRRRRT